MVIYDLVCNRNHEFEGWFKDSSDFDEQQTLGALTCPICNSLEVFKKITAAKVTRKSNTGDSTLNMMPTSDSAKRQPGTQTEEYLQFQKMLRKVHHYIDANFEDVGNRFAQEAIKMHQGEREESNIKGTASADEVAQLASEGIQTVALPPKPVDPSKLN